MINDFFYLEDLKPSERRVYHVSEITRRIRIQLEEQFQSVWIEGEVSNFKRHSSGHFYFTLKDENAQIGCVMWRGRNRMLHFRPSDGMRIIAFGNITLYEKSGRYQLDIQLMQPAGIGDLQLAFEALKERLNSEGLFDPDLKKSLPFLPSRIALITSPTGAAIQDMISVMQRRCPCVEIIILPVRVQGDGAAREIVSAIELCHEYGDLDVIIVGRGGGSLEDLWTFNEEIVARAIFNATIPVISAVGHEIDFTISDFASDMRAPTPSAAAEMVVPERRDLLSTLTAWQQRLNNATNVLLTSHKDRVYGLKNRYAFKKPGIDIREYRFRVDDVDRQLSMMIQQKISDHSKTIQHLEAAMVSMHPDHVLKRGYSITKKCKNEEIVLDSNALEKDDCVSVQFAKGMIKGRVEDVVN